MTDPVTVFMLVVAGVLVVGTVGEQVFARTGVPSVIWLVVLGVLVRVADIVPAAVIHMLAPFFAALALVIILFDAGTNLTGGAGEAALAPATRKRAQMLAFIGFAASVVLVALFSWGLAGLGILKSWSWVHAFMLGSLMACGASEVVLPSLVGLPSVAEATALLRRESAITKALAVTGTVVCLDLLSPRVSEGGAALAMTAGFGFALAFGSVAGMLWVVALQRLANISHVGIDVDARNYGFTLAAMVVLHVLSEAAGGSGPLSVLVFGAVLGNAEGILHMFGRGAGETSSEVQAALGGHARTIQFVRTLVFVMVGLTLAPPWGPIVMGVALALLLLIVRLAVARFTLAGLDHRERSIVGACAPRGLATVALVTLPLAHAVPGAAEMVTLVFSAVMTSVLLFTLGMHGLGRVAPARVVTVPATRATRPEAAPEEQVVVEPEAVRPGLLDRPRSATPSTAQSMVDELSGAETRPPVVPRERSGAQRSAGPHTPRWPREHSGPQVRLAREGSGPQLMGPREPQAVVRERSGAQAVVRERSGAQVVAGEMPTLALELGAPRAAEVEVRAQRPHEPEGYMQTLLQIDAAAEDPLASAMARALARRPDDVAPVRRFLTSDVEVSAGRAAVDGGSDEEALVAGLGSSGDDAPRGRDGG